MFDHRNLSCDSIHFQIWKPWLENVSMENGVIVIPNKPEDYTSVYELLK